MWIKTKEMMINLDKVKRIIIVSQDEYDSDGNRKDIYSIEFYGCDLFTKGSKS